MENSNTLQSVFSAFCGGGKEMDGRGFAKLCKDCGLLDKKFTTTDVDLIQAKVRDKTTKKMNLSQLEAAIGEIATKKGCSKDDVSKAIISHGGPKFEGTKADFVKFHDDKSTYTGVYAKGGPTNVDVGHGKVSDISQLCDRTGADVRGVKK
jgi:hypothetical protein